VFSATLELCKPLISLCAAHTRVAALTSKTGQRDNAVLEHERVDAGELDILRLAFEFGQRLLAASASALAPRRSGEKLRWRKLTRSGSSNSFAFSLNQALSSASVG